MPSNRSGLATIAILIGTALATVAIGGFLMREFDFEIVRVHHENHDHAMAANTHGEWVKFANATGDSVRAYVAYPERAGKAPAIIVIHEVFGLTSWEPTVADSFAKKGYVAIVPDLLSSRFGMSPASDDSGRKLVAQLAPAGVTADLDAAYKYITAQPATNPDRVGIIGFCWGGGNVWSYAASNTRLKAAVACYGPVSDTLMLRRIRTPILGVYGEKDERVNGMIPATTRALDAEKVPFSLETYDGTGHGFLKPGRAGYGTPGAVRAQHNIDAFFTKYLEGK